MFLWTPKILTCSIRPGCTTCQAMFVSGATCLATITSSPPSKMQTCGGMYAIVFVSTPFTLILPVRFLNQYNVYSLKLQLKLEGVPSFQCQSCGIPAENGKTRLFPQFSCKQHCWMLHWWLWSVWNGLWLMLHHENLSSVPCHVIEASCIWHLMIPPVTPVLQVSITNPRTLWRWKGPWMNSSGRTPRSKPFRGLVPCSFSNDKSSDLSIAMEQWKPSLPCCEVIDEM